MKVLLVLPPTAEKPAYAEPPAGLLYAGSALKRAGHEVDIIDIYRNYTAPLQLLQIVKNNKYEVVGFGGITTCYWYVKEASKLIREQVPSVHLIAGGVLSSAYELLLQNTPIDVICMKEGEITIVNIVNKLAQGSREFEDIKGVAFIRDGKIIKTFPEPFINNLDDIPVPDYDLIDMDIYAFDAMKDPFFSIDPSSREFYRSGMRVFNLKTARGCTNACTFCYRHFLGYRQHSVDYVIKHIRYLQGEYNVHFYRFGDELFTRNKDWVMEFTKRLLAEDIRIKYIVHGVRTDNVDKELMDALKRSGCVTVFIGFESGSQRILNVMKKNVTVEQNIKAVKTIIESGLNVLVQTVIAMPGEKEETIRETIESLIQTGIDPEWVSVNYAQAYPGTWMWQYAIKNGFITDKEKYLIEIGRSNDYAINYTGLPDAVTKKWAWKIRSTLLKSRAKNTKRLIDILQTFNPQLYGFGYIYKRNGLMSALQATVAYFSNLMRRKHRQ